MLLRSASCGGAHWHRLGTTSSHSYSFSRQRGTFYQAEKYCDSVGGSVVEINSESEYMLVSRKIGKTQNHLTIGHWNQNLTISFTRLSTFLEWEASIAETLPIRDSRLSGTRQQTILDLGNSWCCRPTCFPCGSIRGSRRSCSRPCRHSSCGTPRTWWSETNLGAKLVLGNRPLLVEMGI